MSWSMKHGRALASSAALVLTVIAFSASAASAMPPGKATLRGNGVVSTRDYEQDSSFTADGRTLYFTKRTLWPAYASVLCESHLVNGHWSEPTVLPFSGALR